ncbi:hypothetical protein BDV97DRAFT_394904 [Delphinella strobiligena]|nr:hypothetical protein BDV97DRAFT_394904 [Delphinella strobiligena]
MPPNPTSFDGPISLALKRNVSWILKEPVLVTWKDPCETEGISSLGQPCPLNGNTNVTLWVGERPEENLVVTLLQMTISIKVSSRKKSFDLFFILPTNKLCVNHDDGNFPAVLINDVSPEVYECLEHTRLESSEKKRLVHLPFLLDSPGQVLMNSRPENAKPVTGTPLHLMLLLKSLSQVLAFEVYMGYSTFATESLRRLRTRLAGGARSPEVDLEKSYACAGGAFDNWAQYNLEHLSHDTSRHTTISRKRPRTSSSSAKSPLRQREYQQRTEDLVAVPPPPYVQSDEVSPPANLRASQAVDTQVLVAQSDCAASPAEGQLDVDDYIPETPQDTNSYAHVVTSTSMYSAVQFEKKAETQLNMALPLFDSECTTANTTPRDLMTAWILNMKTIDSDFYKVPRIHQVILSLGSAAVRGDSHQFIEAKARGTTIVLARAAARAGLCNSDAAQSLSPLQQVEKLTLWMYGFHVDADEVMLSFLQSIVCWAVAWTRYTRSRSLTKESEQKDAQAESLMRMFQLREAECVTRFFCHDWSGDGFGGR